MKKILIIGIVISLGMVLTACGSTDSLNLKETYTVELGEQVSINAKDYLTKDTEKDILENTKISFADNKNYMVDKKKNILIPTNGKYLPVGKYHATANYQSEEKSFTVEVKDTKAPNFINFDKEVEIEIDSNVDLRTYYKAEDLSDATISIKGKYDLKKIGEYKIKVIAKDSYGNKVTKVSTVKVIPKSTVKESEDTPTNPNQETGGSSNSATNNNNINNNTTPTPPAPNVCVPNGTYMDLGNSGRWFTSEEEMDAWAWKQLDYGKGPWGKLGYDGYHAWTVRDSCGEERNDIWTVHFY